MELARDLEEQKGIVSRIRNFGARVLRGAFPRTYFPEVGTEGGLDIYLSPAETLREQRRSALGELALLPGPGVVRASEIQSRLSTER
jgi:hypothetical protein